MNPITPTLTPKTLNPFAGVTVQASGNEPLPNNSYFAEFVNVEPFANDKVKDKLKWKWKVVAGPHTGREATALTDVKLTPHTQAGRLLGGLVGRPLVPCEDVGALWNTLQSAVGKRFMVVVASGPKGGKASVQSVTLPPEM
jgi:hypothetical protein